MRADPRELAAVFAGGALGALARALLEDALPHAPVTRLQERLPLSAYRRPFLGTGICGGLTTFSAFQVELLQMLDAGRAALALGYATASIAAGAVAVALATNLVRRARVAP